MDTAIPTKRYVYNPSSGKHGKSAKAVRFIRGPIPFAWIQRANALPGKAGAIGAALWFLKGVKESSTFVVTAEAVELAGCCRQTFIRGLEALATAGLLELRRRDGKRPIVVLIDDFSPPL